MLELALRVGMIATDDADGVVSLRPPDPPSGAPDSPESRHYINNRWRARRRAGALRR
ncbi:hypothetical protein [Nocardia sp. NPDC004722]